jgi:hypothetical protein
MRDCPEAPIGQSLIDMQHWLQENTRDIIDESDEVLHPRQQVIYTVGKQRNLDAAPWRWELVQRLLSLLVRYFSQIENTSNEEIPFIIEYSGNPGSFPSSIRFEDGCTPIIREFMIHSILRNEWSLRPDVIDLCLNFVIAESFSENSYRELRQRCPESSSHILYTALILRGVLHHNLLLHIFKDKRYRVNYGLDTKRTLLAVPYRAKDLPSPRSEFGHPEVITILTCLSYYYGGLSSENIKETLEHLQKSGTPDLTYQEWLRPCWNQVQLQLQKLEGLNVQEEHTLEENLFPLLKYNKLCIDSYLNWVVFPRHAKEFPSKLTSSGWDLAMTKLHLTTGFSGTNDGRFLLPTTITQLDRPAQLHTNAKVLSYLLQRENSRVHRYPHTSSSSILLDEILGLEPRPTVILDVGAQVLDKSNEEFSRLWLSRYEDHPVIKAIVFFNGDELTVMTPDGLSHPLMDSPYAERLDQCLVYLDDAHTRGTDLRLPNVRAVVTLGPRLTKDKLVQGAYPLYLIEEHFLTFPIGCMRMRRLGQGQRVSFLASNDVVRLVMEATGCQAHEIKSKHVLIWTIKETWKQLQENLPIYVVQGHSFVRRQTAWVEHEAGRLSHQQLAEILCETESRSLEKLYGPVTEDGHSWVREYHSPDAASEISRAIYQLCNDFRSFSLTSASMNEEIELELVHERELERVIERPPPAAPAAHRIHPDLTAFIRSGELPQNSDAFHHITRALQNTSIPIPSGLCHVLNDLFVTLDFCRTIQPLSPVRNSMDDFIRPVEWIIVPNVPEPSFAVALSSFEANALFNNIKSEQRVRLYLFSHRKSSHMRTFEDFDHFILPSQVPAPIFPRGLAHQINIFSGSVFLRDLQTYRDVCRLLGLHFDRIEASDSFTPANARPTVIDSTYFVTDPATRAGLGMNNQGLLETPVPFLMRLLVTRRHGQGLGPSHMGKLLQGVRLTEEDFISQGSRA